MRAREAVRARRRAGMNVCMRAGMQCMHDAGMYVCKTPHVRAGMHVGRATTDQELERSRPTNARTRGQGCPLRNHPRKHVKQTHGPEVRAYTRADVLQP